MRQPSAAESFSFSLASIGFPFTPECLHRILDVQILFLAVHRKARGIAESVNLKSLGQFAAASFAAAIRPSGDRLHVASY
jgi:hypothetical protein